MTNLINQNLIPNTKGLYDERLANQLAKTQGAISALNQLTLLLQNPLLLMRPILAKEAESSSQLEGTQASIEDVYKIDIADQTIEQRNEALEVRNYQDAMLKGLDLLHQPSISALTIREIQKTLMQGVRGSKKHPGEYRLKDVWIGDEGTDKGSARYVPPDALQVPILMENLINFINNPGTINPLIACAIIHHRFEAIHPFEDGNGRTGRLLISLFLIKNKLLKLPILYPSGYFEKNKSSYTGLLHQLDDGENWYEWVLYFLMALEEQANLSYSIGIQIVNLFKTSRDLIKDENSGLKLISLLELSFNTPYLTVPNIYRDLAIAHTTSARYLEKLVNKEILLDIGIPKNKKERVFVNDKLINILTSI